MKYITRAVSVVFGLTLVIGTFGSSVASAKDSYSGETYADVAAAIAGRNGKAIVATVDGSQLPSDDCIVASWTRGVFRDSSGQSRSHEYFLNLDCNQALASPGHPGNSLMSPAGRRAKLDEALARKIAIAKDSTMEWCDEHAARCQQVCKETKLCGYA